MIAGAAIAGFIIAAVCALIRLMWGPSLADRVAALDVALTSLMGAIVVDAVNSGDGTYINLLVVIAIVGFTATVSAARFIEHEGGPS